MKMYFSERVSQYFINVIINRCMQPQCLSTEMLEAKIKSFHLNKMKHSQWFRNIIKETAFQCQMTEKKANKKQTHSVDQIAAFFCYSLPY